MRTTAEHRLVIIGSGPAAFTAAVYAGRARLSPLVVEGEVSREMVPGGQLMFTTDIENFPGFPDPIGGQELMDRMRAQALSHGAAIYGADVLSLDVTPSPFRLTLSDGSVIGAHAVIVATGAHANWLGLPNEERLARSGGGVSACAVCDGALPAYRGRRLLVVGGGDSAMEEAMYLSKYASEVVILHRRGEFRASRAMAERVEAHPTIRVEWHTEVVDVEGADFITGVRVRDMRTGEHRHIECGGLFVAIGHTPNTAFLQGTLGLDEAGYILTPSPWRTVTTVPGVFAAGDVMDAYYRQAITASGMGCMAALEAERWLAHQHVPGAESPVVETAQAPSTLQEADG